jgi:hypothetical protein
VKSVIANLEVLLGILMMPFLLPMLRPRYWQQSVISFIFVAIGVTLIVHGLRRVVRLEKEDSRDRHD